MEIEAKYSLSGKGSSTSVTLRLAGDQTFRYQDQFAAIFTVPNHGNVMPLAIVDRRVFPEREINVLQIVEQRHLDSIAVCLDHESFVCRNVR